MLNYSATCRKIDVAHIASLWEAGLSPCQDGDKVMSNSAGSSTAGAGINPTVLAGNGSRKHSQAGNSAALHGAGLIANPLHHVVQEHS